MRQGERQDLPALVAHGTIPIRSVSLRRMLTRAVTAAYFRHLRAVSLFHPGGENPTRRPARDTAPGRSHA